MGSLALQPGPPAQPAWTVTFFVSSGVDVGRPLC